MTASDPRVGEDCATCLGCPDCGTPLSKRTPAAISLRLSKVSDGPWTAWDRGIGYEVHGPHGEPINDRHRETFTRGDAEFIASAPTDVAYLLAELADRDEKLARVEAAVGLSCTIHSDCVKGEVRAEFAGSSTPTIDVTYLLTELQALAAELSRDAENAQHYAEHGYGNADGVREAIFGAEVATRIRAAVAAAKGGEDAHD